MTSSVLRSSSDDTAGLRRLRLVGIALPVLVIVALQVIRPTVIHRLWPERGDLVFGALTVVAALAFGLAMFFFIDRLIDRLQRRRREAQALSEVLLQIIRQDSPSATLATVVGVTRRLLDGADAGMCLNRRAAALPASVHEDGRTNAAPVCLAAHVSECGEQERPDCPLHATTHHDRVVSMPLRGSGDTLGQLWIRPAHRITSEDEAFLATMGELAVVALDQARLIETERQGATLAERDRIAREMHDSLAQALGVAHLRLCALTSRHEVAALPRVHDDLADLAGLCEDAYRDVREAILALRHSSRTDATLLESLHTYVQKFSASSRIDTRLDADIDGEVVLDPQCEVQVIRVIQEALTNVRKHSGASSVCVRIVETPQETTFVVEDDGAGFDPSLVTARREGFGLHSMRERAELVDASLRIESRPGHGTKVVVGVPGARRVSRPAARTVGA